MTRDSANWNLPPPPGFQGLREDLPLEIYTQTLPHWRQNGATYFVTFRLHDSLPREKLDELRAVRAAWEERLEQRGRSRGLKSTLRQAARRGKVELEEDEMARDLMRRVETWLDQGMGSCCLRKMEAARQVTDAIHAADGTRCEVGCYVEMPNHVHAALRPLNPTVDPLEKILQSWKGSSARRINELLGRLGTLWQRESFDRIIRDEEHLWRVLQYIGSNPRKAGVAESEAVLWVRPDWVELGWRFEEERQRPQQP